MSLDFKKICSVLSLLFLVASCGPTNQTDPSMKEGKFFALNEEHSDEDSLSKTNFIALKKSALGKEFLFQGSIILQAMVGRFNNLKSRVVKFKKVDNFLLMLETTHGHSITHDLSQNFILAKFPITKEKSGLIHFNFSAGMSKVFVSSDWTGQDFSGGNYSSNSWKAESLDVSFIKSARIDKKENLIIRQIAQVNEKNGNKVPVELKYYLSPYKVNKNFVPTQSKNFKKMGFFEIAPQLQPGGKKVIYASKFDHSKPIIFAISSNTPANYRSAIREGVLYWNKSFGREVLKVVDAPKGVSAPDFDYNVIQWVDWKTAGFAYADAQMDPRTGEILHAQVFLTSVFAFSSKRRAKDLLNLLRKKTAEEHSHGDHDHDHHHNDPNDPETYLEYLNLITKKDHSPSHININGFQKKSMCNFQASEAMLDGLVSLLEREGDVSEETYLKISQDYVREVVAHEVGHTLGLRHNFAGSLYANFDHSEKSEIFLNYVKEGKAPSHLRSTSSVMEYQNFEESVMTGDQLLTKNEPLDYDKKVIQSLYFGKSYKKSELPPFCTDSHRSKYLDCRTFDGGRSIYMQSLWQEKRSKENLPFILLNTFVNAKKLTAAGDLDSLAEITPNPLHFSLSSISGRLRILESLSQGSSLLKVEHNFPYINHSNQSEVAKKKSESISNDIKAAGGLTSLFKATRPNEIRKIENKFNELLSQHNQNMNLGDATHFTPDELELIKSQTKDFFQGLAFSYFMADFIILSRSKNLISHEASTGLTKLLSDKAFITILAASGTEEISTELGTVKVPKFIFPYSFRIMATKLLNSKSTDLIWGLREKYQIKNNLTSKMKEAFEGKMPEVNMVSYPDKLNRWIKQNKKILSALN